MMLNIDIEEMRAGFWRHAPVAGVVGTLLAVALILILVNPKTDLAAFGLMKDIPADYNNIRDLGSRIYTDYLLPFELAAVLLLLGMVAAIALVHRKTVNPKRMDPADQVKVRADKGRMRLVKMEAVKPQVEICRRKRSFRRPQAGRGGQSMITLTHYLVLGALLFGISAMGIFMNRKNVLVLLMSIELMLLAVNFNFIAFSQHLGDTAGQIFVFFVLTVAAAESAIGFGDYGIGVPQPTNNQRCRFWMS